VFGIDVWNVLLAKAMEAGADAACFRLISTVARDISRICRRSVLIHAIRDKITYAERLSGYKHRCRNESMFMRHTRLSFSRRFA